MLPVKVFMSIQHCNKMPSLRKNLRNTITISKTEFRENICLKIAPRDVRLLEYGN